MSNRKQYVLLFWIAVMWLGLAGAATPVHGQRLAVRKRTRLLISIPVLVMMIGAIFFAGKPQLSSAQNEGFKLYQLNVHCGSSSLVTEIFTHAETEGGTVGRPLMGTMVICAGKKCPGGPVPLRDALAKFPAKVSAAIQAKVDKYQEDLANGEDWFLTCLGDGKNPPEDKQPKCEPPPGGSRNPPWLKKDSSSCDWQRATLSWSQRSTSNPNLDVSYTIAICGEVIRYMVPRGGYLGAPSVGLRGFDVCCESWRNAAQTKSPCDARADIDCDGDPNEKDDRAEYAWPDGRSPNDFVSEPMTGIPFWQKIYPRPMKEGDVCECKWELVRVDYTCKNTPNLQSSNETGGRVWEAIYDYTATWKCPRGGKTFLTEDTVVMAGRQCPIPPNRTWP